MPRVGRGEALRKLLLEQKELTDPELPPPPLPEQKTEVSNTRRSMGRGMIFASLMSGGSGDSSAVSPSSVPDASQSSVNPPMNGSVVNKGVSKPARTAGRGRGYLLASLSLTKPEEVISDTAPTTVVETPIEVNEYVLQEKSQSPTVSVSGSNEKAPSSERPSSPTLSVTSSLSGLSLQEKPPVVMKGSFGQQANMTCNYIRLSLEPGKGVYEYEVRYNPDIDSQKYRYDLLYQHKNIIGEVRTFDGSVLYLPFQLPDAITTAVSKLPSDGSDVKLKIIFKRKKRLGETIHLYNVLFRKIMNHLGLVLMGRNFFDPTCGKPIPAHRLEVWPGFITAIDEYEGGVMLCCDASHKVLRTETCLELMEDLMQVMPHHEWKQQFMSLIIGKSVLTRYNNKTYRVDDVLFDKTPMDTFPSRDGSQRTYIDYYQKQYDIKIKCKDQPLLVSRKTGRLKGQEMTQLVNLIPELSYITGLTDSMRSDMKVMKDIAQYTRISPAQRHLCLKKFVQSVNSNSMSQNILGSWGLKLEDATVSLPGRILPPEEIFFARNSEPGKLQADWSRASTSNPVLSAVDMKRWLIVFPAKEEKTVKDFVDMLKRCSPQFGMRIDTPQYVSLRDDKTESYLRALRNQINPEVQLVIIVLLAARADKYSAVKKLCCVECPVPSQVVLMKTIRRPDRIRSVSQKIALQMNCKLGGTLWAVKIPVKKVMVVGIDTYHDPLRKCASISALVMSLNPQLTRWYSRIGKQESGEELMDSITVNFLAGLDQFNKIHGFLPEQIQVFRDGMGDGQLEHCQKYEIQQLMKACQVIKTSYMPKILFVVVQKKINTRLFLKTGDGGLDNPPPGSIMDHSICRRNWFDFFLVSQNVHQGTVSPTHYVVIHNSTSMTPDQIQRFSYKLTHLYYNWPGPIRVPAPCQYAHKLAYLVGESIQKEANENLQDKLYYL